jgi:hypothetical protein
MAGFWHTPPVDLPRGGGRFCPEPAIQHSCKISRRGCIPVVPICLDALLGMEPFRDECRTSHVCVIGYAAGPSL